VKTVVTYTGVSIEPETSGAALTVDVAPLEIGNFIRCDPNNDGRSNIADAVWLVNELFRSGPATECPDAADCNDDELIDLSDAAYAVAYRFQDGAAPPPPFPDCGGDDDQTEASCPAGTTRCP
jgi:hypothetical protein